MFNLKTNKFHLKFYFNVFLLIFIYINSFKKDNIDMKKKSLVIGGSSGFGKYLVDYLRKKNHIVHFTGTKSQKKNKLS